MPLPRRHRPKRPHSHGRKHNSVQTRSRTPKRSQRRVRRHRKRPRPNWYTPRRRSRKSKSIVQPQPAASSPAKQTPEQSPIAEAVAEYLALGGPLGGGFAAPAVDTYLTGDDWTAEFRERVSACSKVPEEVGADNKVAVTMRLFLNRDGTVASPPRLLVPAPSAKQQALMESAVDALERCQPFTMLPPEKYKQWKTMVVYVTPFAHR